MRSKDSCPVRRGAIGKVPYGNSLVAYSTASPVLNGGDEETGQLALRLVPTQQGYDVASHYIVVGDGQGGKERVTVLPLNNNLPCSAMCML